VKRALVALASFAAVAACASDPSTVAVPSSTTTAPTSVATVAPTTPAPSGTAAIPTTMVPPVEGMAPPAPRATSRGMGAPGSNAPLYLRPAPAKRLRLQLLVEAAAAPRQGTVDHVVRVFGSASGKQVSVLAGALPASGDRTWDDAAIAAAASARAPALRSDEALVQLLFVNGTYAGGDGVVGVAVNGGVAAVFSDRIAATATGLASPDRLERAVATHELGHLLGLVDLFLRTGRADPDHPGHSSNPRSVMYWAVETDVVGDLLTGGPPVEFDADDQADLAAIRGG
jgi:hypothetical protein